jgi:hypothetical protein
MVIIDINLWLFLVKSLSDRPGFGRFFVATGKKVVKV